MRDRFSAPYGTYVIAVWAVVLGLQNLVRLIYTLAVDNGGAAQSRLFLYQWVSVLFSIAFIAAAVGIWQRKNWGRKLFLLSTPLFFAIAIFGVFTADKADISSLAQWSLSVRYAISIAIPWIYLNLPFVTHTFLKQTEDITPYD